jgi:DAK2 domain fusion protein YloV
MKSDPFLEEASVIEERIMPSTKWQQCNGRQLSKLIHAGLIWLEKHREEVNALNVFPVPDGDTGTNMLLTMRSAYERIKQNNDLPVGRVAHELAHGALMGARGNSGVILSQIWRGLALGLKNKETASVQDMAVALKQASETAYHGVMRPVEGTILTVIREGSEEAIDAADKSEDLRFFLERVLERCQQALERTPEMLPVLKQAGVVDSGGQGLVYILEGMLYYVNGHLAITTPPAGTALSMPAQALAVPEDGKLENPYDVQFILMGQDLDVLAVRETIDSMGDSTVVVGDESTIKVHVHVQDPGQPLSYGISLGHITDVVVENMQEQMDEIVTPNGSPAFAGSADLGKMAVEIQPGQIGVVAVAPGEGFADIFRSLGVAQVIHGGQTNNPSTEEIFQAINEIPSDKVIILPNNKNIFLAAEAACQLSPKQVAIVPTRTIPQGLSAMLAWNADGELESTVEAMAEASGFVTSAEITTATRSVQMNGVSVEAGHIIGLCDSTICTTGSNINQVLLDTLQHMDMTAYEILSVYYGQEVDRPEAETLIQQITDLYPDLEVELLAGKQPHYFYILGAE